MAATTLPLIPSTVVGSHGARLVALGVKAYEAGEMGPGDLEEMLDDAADTAIRDMERAGIDVITDGEVRRLDGYVDSYYAIIKGIQPLDGAAQGRALGLRPADALRGGRQDRDARRAASASSRSSSTSRRTPGEAAQGDLRRARSPSARASTRARCTRAWSTWRSASRR